MLTAALMLGVGLGSFCVGPLREWLSLERLYQLSAGYPLMLLTLALLFARMMKPAPARASPF
jgi:predicted MFS family arabinose efflux permease